MNVPLWGMYVDRQAVSEHLPLAWSRSDAQDEDLLMSNLEDLAVKFSSA